LAVSAEVAQTISASLITIAGGAGGTSAGVGGTGGSVTTLDTTYSASRGSYSGGDGGTASGSNGAGGGGAAGYAGDGADAGAAAAANSGAGGGGGASTDRRLWGGGGVGIFGLTGDDGTAGTASTPAGGGSNFVSAIGDIDLYKVVLLLKGDSDTPYNLGVPGSFSVTRHGSTTGSSRFVTGKYGSAFDFNGTDDYLELSGGDLSSRPPYLGTAGDWTIEMWVNYDVMTQFTGPIATDRDKVLPTGNTAGEFDFHIRTSSAPHNMSFFVRDDPNSNITITNTNVAITAGTWHHVAASFVSSTNTLYLGVDGTVASSTNSAFASISLGAENALQIGKNRTGLNFFNGQIEDIRLTEGVARYTSSYTVPAAAHPIIHARSGVNGFNDSDGAQADFSQTTDYSTIPVTAGLIVHLDAGVTASYSGSGSTWYDLTSNNNDFTLYNSPTYSSGNGGKFQFNGSTQYAAGGPNLSTSDCTVISIHRYATNSNSARGRITAGNSNNWWVGNHGGNTSYYAAGQISYTAGHDTNFHIYAATENFSADNRVFYNNNVAPSGQTPSAGSEGPNGIQFGRWGNQEYSDCEVAVLLVYNRILIATELTAIFNFYKSRFGIS
jgi:hypothetical protein